jgi:ubiquinone/menaquinone biosynthesis C-methylase UbiE
MEPGEYETMYHVEDQHWWYTGMKQITLTLVDHCYPGRTDLAILDAGCGTGAVMGYLAPFGRVTGCDISPLALNFCRQRGLTHLGQSSVTRLPFPAESFDLVTSFDVLYHRAVGDYRNALVEFHRVLKPDGRLFLRLPAYNWLRGHHDEIIHTTHRFTAGELQQALTTSQFTVEKLSYANTLLFPLALGKRLAEKIFPPQAGMASDVKANSERQDKLLARFLHTEARWLKKVNLPFGLTVIAIARR